MIALEIKFPIVVYSSEDAEGGRFTAHCLNMDLVADDDCVEGALSKLLESIEAGIDAAVKHNASPFRDAPRQYWDRLARAKQLPRELRERVIFNANKRHVPAAVNVESQCDFRVSEELQLA